MPLTTAVHSSEARSAVAVKPASFDAVHATERHGH